MDRRSTEPKDNTNDCPVRSAWKQGSEILQDDVPTGSTGARPRGVATRVRAPIRGHAGGGESIDCMA